MVRSETIFGNWKPFKLMKNAFPLPYNLFLFSKYFNFCLDFLVIKKNALIKTIRLTSKFVTSQPGKETFAMHILPSISKSKGNQTMKFGQLINITWGTFFFKNTHTNCVGDTIPRPFSTKSKFSISLDQQSKASYSLFLLYAKLRTINIYWN